MVVPKVEVRQVIPALAALPPRPQADEPHAEQEQGGAGFRNSINRTREFHVIEREVVASSARDDHARSRQP